MKKLLIPCCLLLLTNCVDNKYDKEIDMNVTIAENGISIPIGETDKFTLSKLISTDDNLKINGDSVYYISESTRSTTEFAAIQSVAIDQSNGLAPNIEPTKILLPEEVISAVENGIKFNTSIPLTLSADVPVDPSELNISKEIERIDTILFDAPKEAVLTITTEIYEEQGPANFALQLSDMTMSLPHMLMLAPSGNIGDVTLEDTDDNGNPLAIRDHVLYIPQKNAEKGIFTISVKIYGLCGGEIRPDGTNDFLLLPSSEDENILDIVNNKFTLDGNASVEIELNGAGTILAAQPQVRTDFSIEELEITRIAGIIDASAHESFSIEIGSMPDFLEGNDITLDLSNPYIKLCATNPMGIPVKTHLTIDPKDSNGESLNAEPITVDTIYMAQATYDATNHVMIPSENNIYISQREPTTSWVDAEKKTFWLNDTLYTWAQGNLPALLNNKIPSSLEATVSAQTDKNVEHIALLNNQPSEVSVSCDITVPMEFGENFAINFSEIEGGLDDIFADFSMQEAAIIASYTTTLPLDLEFTLEPLQKISAEEYLQLPADERVIDDEEDNNPEYYRIIKGIDLEVLNSDENGKGIIAGATDMSLYDPTPSTGKIVIRLTENSNGALKSITDLRYRIDGSLSEGLESGALRSTQYLQLKLSARLAKIEVDLDTL